MKKTIILIALLLTVLTVNAQTQNSFYGSVSNVQEGDLVLARVNGNNYISFVKNSQYGYDEELKVYGNEGDIIEFYVDEKKIEETILKEEGFTKLDLDPTKPFTKPAEILPPSKPPEPQAPTSLQEPVKEKKFPWVWFIFFLVLIIIGVSIGIYFLQKQGMFELKLLKKTEKEIPKPVFKLPLKKEEPPSQMPEPRKPVFDAQKKDRLQELINYIKEMKKRGYQELQIKATLYAQGWKNTDIEKAFQQIQNLSAKK